MPHLDQLQKIASESGVKTFVLSNKRSMLAAHASGRYGGFHIIDASRDFTDLPEHRPGIDHNCPAIMFSFKTKAERLEFAVALRLAANVLDPPLSYE